MSSILIKAWDFFPVQDPSNILVSAMVLSGVSQLFQLTKNPGITGTWDEN